MFLKVPGKVEPVVFEELVATLSVMLVPRVQ